MKTTHWPLLALGLAGALTCLLQPARGDDAACIAEQKKKLHVMLDPIAAKECDKARLQAGYVTRDTIEIIRRLNELIPPAGPERRDFEQNSRNGSDLGSGGDLVSILPDKQVQNGSALSFRLGPNAGKPRDCYHGTPSQEIEERLVEVESELRAYCSAVSEHERKGAAGDKKAKAPKELNLKKLSSKMSSEKGECVTSGRLTRVITKYRSDQVINRWMREHCGKKL